MMRIPIIYTFTFADGSKSTPMRTVLGPDGVRLRGVVPEGTGFVLDIRLDTDFDSPTYSWDWADA